jgi:hypothetical protein
MDRTRDSGSRDRGSIPRGSTDTKNPEYIGDFSYLCGQGESNSRLILGKDSLYHLTMAANVSNRREIILYLKYLSTL